MPLYITLFTIIGFDKKKKDNYWCWKKAAKKFHNNGKHCQAKITFHFFLVFNEKDNHQTMIQSTHFGLIDVQDL